MLKEERTKKVKQLAFGVTIKENTNNAKLFIWTKLRVHKQRV
jgi:hypothetical protein